MTDIEARLGSVRGRITELIQDSRQGTPRARILVGTMGLAADLVAFALEQSASGRTAAMDIEARLGAARGRIGELIQDSRQGVPRPRICMGLMGLAADLVAFVLEQAVQPPR